MHPIYVRKGIIPEVAAGLQSATDQANQIDGGGEDGKESGGPSSRP